MPTNSSERRITSVKNAFEILEHLHDHDDASLGGVADAVGLTKGTVHTYLATMVAAGYVRRDEGAYRLSLRFLDLGETVLRDVDGVDVVGDVLRDIVARTGDIAWFIVEEDGEAVFVEKAAGENAVQPYGSVGKHTTLHDIAGGKAILAHLPEERVAEILDDRGLPGRTEDTIVDREAFERELERVRERGYAANDGENVAGWRAVAAPVFHEGDLLGAIAASGPAHRLRGERFEADLPGIVKDAANEVQLRLLSRT